MKAVPTDIISIKGFKVIILCILIFIAVISISAISDQGDLTLQEIAPHENRPGKLFLPENGCIPDEKTAIHIAEIVWLSVYGDSIYKRKPFRAELLGDSLWIVAGSLQPNMLGGVPYIEIQKKDCKILGIGHGK
jgi:hypothetical protein